MNKMKIPFKWIFLFALFIQITNPSSAQTFSSDPVPHTNVLATSSETILKTAGYRILQDEQQPLRGGFRKEPYLIYKGIIGEMTILWQLQATESCTIKWGTDLGYSTGSSQTDEFGSDHQHQYTIQGLFPSTLYYYSVFTSTDTVASTFRSAPPVSEKKLKFFAYGDTRTFPYFHNNVASEMVDTYTSDTNYQTFVLHVGDLIEDGDSESSWDDEFFATGYNKIQTMLSNVPMQACMGNHEGSGVLFQKYFPYPYESDRYWSFDYGPAHFTVIDQYVPYGLGSAQLTWIENDLAATDKQWKIVYLHEPGWSSGGHANVLTVQNYIHPLCVEYGAYVIFAGHNHYYARAKVNNYHHITSGGGGGPLFPPLPWWPYIVESAMAYHFCRISIDHNALLFEAVKSDGSIIDQFSIIPTLSVTPSGLNLGPDGETTYFVIDNTSVGPLRWDATISTADTSWLSILGDTTGVENDTLFVICDTNYSDARTGHLTISAPGASNNPVLVEINQSIATDNLVLFNKTISTGEDTCWSANISITAPGDNSTFIVSSGGNAILVADSIIRLKPGFIAHEGCYFHGYIDITGCPLALPEQDLVYVNENPDTSEIINMAIYPNPTDGSLNITFDSPDISSLTDVYIYDIMGRLIKSNIVDNDPFTMDLSGLDNGMYIIKLMCNNVLIVKKIIKR